MCDIAKVRRRPVDSELGQRLRTARGRRGITLTALAARARVSVSSLSRFESGASHPGFEDVCAIAKALGTPLLFLADGRDRTGSDPRDLIAHLAYWGLHDLVPGDAALIGESRPFESLVAQSLGDVATPRILEGIPALLLKNDFSTAELVAQATGSRVLHRLGWLAEIAEWIASQIPVSRIYPSASNNARRVRLSAWNHRQDEFMKLPKNAHWPDGWDLVESLSTGVLNDRDSAAEMKRNSPIATKWKIAYSSPQEAFLSRARDILAAPEPG